MKRGLLAIVLGFCVLVSLVVGGGVAATGATTQESLLGSATPRVLRDPDTVPVTLGVVVTPKAAGKISAVRFYKGSSNTGTHVGVIYSDSGAELARATFRNESESGWQTVTFSAPVDVAAGRRITAAVFMPKGGYVVTNPFNWPIQTPSLTASAGVYHYGDVIGRPSQIFGSSNYFIDVSFQSTSSSAAPSPSASTATPPPSAPPTKTASPQPSGPTQSPSSAIPTPTPSVSPIAGWPDATNTGVAGCPALEKVNNGDEVRLATDGQVYENKELLNPAVIRVVAHNVTIRCVKMNGTGWFGIDNTDLKNPASNATDTQIDRVDISCKAQGQRIGILAKAATVTRSNVYQCDHFMNAGGDNLVIRDNYCHDLTNLPVVHADCIQTMGGNNNMLIEHNSLWSRDTSDILLGQEYGDARNVVINNNRMMSVGSPAPAYLLYLSGTNTKVTNNRFTRRYTYGACTLNTSNPVVWSGNVWDDNGSAMPYCGSR